MAKLNVIQCKIESWHYEIIVISSALFAVQGVLPIKATSDS